MTLSRAFFCLCWLAVASMATFSSDPTPSGELTVVSVPTGGQIVYGALAGQKSVQGAMGAMLRKVHDHFGERPQVGRLFCQNQCQLLGTFFSVAAKNEGGKPYSGMVVVSVGNGQASGAVLYDDARRFPSSLNPMLQRLKTEWKPAPAGATESGTPAAGPVNSVPLHSVNFPDGSGSLDLPDGWQLVAAHGGAVDASGPHGEEIHFGRYFSAMNSANPTVQRQIMMETQGGRLPLPGMYVAIPWGTDPVQALDAAAAQLAQKQRRPAPTITVQDTQQSTMQGRPVTIVRAIVDRHDGKEPFTASIQVSTGQQDRFGTWGLYVNQINAPTQLFDGERGTLRAIAES